MTDALQQFADLAASYCDLIEGGLSGGPAEQAGELARLLAQLYAAAAALPEVWDDRFEEMEEVRVSSEEYRRVYRGMADVLAEYDCYWAVTVFSSEMTDPSVEPEPSLGQLHDDLSDIWRELKAGLRSWERGSKLNQSWAAWHWRTSFHGHWDYHVVDALKMLHIISTQ